MTTSSTRVLYPTKLGKALHKSGGMHFVIDEWYSVKDYERWGNTGIVFGVEVMELKEVRDDGDEQD